MNKAAQFLLFASIGSFGAMIYILKDLKYRKQMTKSQFCVGAILCFILFVAGVLSGIGVALNIKEFW